MSRRRRGSNRRSAASRPAGSGAAVPRQRVRPGAPAPRRQISGVWLLVAAVAGVAALALAVLVGPRLIGGSGATGSPGASGASLPASSPGASAGISCPNSQPPALAAGEQRLVTIATSQGEFAITVRGDWSPGAAGNFVALASCGFYDGVTFHRLVPDFVIQGGDPEGTGGGGPGYTIQDEPVTQAYRRGLVAMARTPAPNSQGSQFFIILNDAAQRSLAAANTYAIFGEVTSGMDVVDRIAAMPNSGEPDNRALEPVAMDRVTVSQP